ncbi:hypothetical protein LB553_10595 [Mesorhizobium sp. CA8]|uniref:hypothetical protein n=1 Tax=Mesorhizobium sp. CA8 TaxID=2876637 RepID=UPI001CCA29AE|nr:hypothetical protein [Mesorhizobium sp. CA8]MBZ9761323.1 hypothetical protein [Mesorhizobium sp. CA8]
MRCENGADHGRLDIEAFAPTGKEALGLRIRRLKALKVHGAGVGGGALSMMSRSVSTR